MEQTRVKLPIKCKGRDINGNQVLEEAVDAIVELNTAENLNPYAGQTTILNRIHCKYNPTGDSSCSANSKKDKICGKCAYYFKIPELSDNYKKAIETIENIKKAISI